VTESNDNQETLPCVFWQWNQYHYLL